MSRSITDPVKQTYIRSRSYNPSDYLPAMKAFEHLDTLEGRHRSMTQTGGESSEARERKK